MIKYLFLSGFCFLFACSSPVKTEGPLMENIFDAEDYLNGLANDKSQYDVEKTIAYNGELKTERIKDYDITSDYDILKKININNPSWIHKYSIDTTKVNNSYVVSYLALENDLRIRSYKAFLDKEYTVVGFEATIIRNALISDNERTIHFMADEGYSINDKSTSVLGEKKEIDIKVDFNLN